MHAMCFCRILTLVFFLCVLSSNAALIPVNPKFEQSNAFENFQPEANSLATIIADWVKLRYPNPESLEEADWLTLSKALAVAKQIAPENSDILVIEFQINQKVALEKTGSMTSLDMSVMANNLINQVKLQESNELLYGYLLELAALMDPKNTEVVLAHMKHSGGKNDWSKLLAFKEVVPSSTAAAEKGGGRSSQPYANERVVQRDAVNRSQSKIKILLVTQQASDLWLGSTNDLIATVSSTSANDLVASFQDKLLERNLSMRRSHAPDTSNHSQDPHERERPVSTVGQTGKQMNLALDEVLRLVKARHPDAQADVELSFEDKYTPKDGGSLGLASAVLLASIVEGFEIDPELSVTGDISADGTVRGVGKVAEKLEGAENAESTLVIIPKENEDVVSTMLIDGEADIFKSIQAFSVGTYKEALEIAKTDKAVKIKEAMELFSSVKAGDSSSNTMDNLRKVLELAPNHLSAQALLRQYSGDIPKYYSFKESVGRTLNAANSFVSILLFEENQSVNLDETERFTIPEIPERSMDESLEKLNKLSPKLDKGAKELHSSVISLVFAWRDMQRRGFTSRTGRENFIDAREDFHEALDQLRLDEEAYRELVR